MQKCNSLILSLLVSIVLLPFYTGCSSSSNKQLKQADPFAGEWMRVGDAMEGLVVDVVVKDANSYVGIIRKAPDKFLSMFPVGEEKWLNLKKSDSLELSGKDVWKSEHKGVTTRSEYDMRLKSNLWSLTLKGVKENGNEFYQQYIKTPTGKPTIFRSKVIPAGEGTEEQFDICLYDKIGYIATYVNSIIYAQAWFTGHPDSSGLLDVSTLNAQILVAGGKEWACFFKGKVFKNDSIVGALKEKGAGWTYEKLTFNVFNVSLNGSWHYEEWGEGPRFITLDLRSTGDTIKGSIDVLDGEDEKNTERNPILSGRLIGNKLNLETNPEGDFKMKYVFNGIVTQNSDIVGSLSRKGESDDGYTISEMTFVPKSRYKSKYK